MDRGQVSSRIAALREECAALGRELADGGHGLAPEEAFAVAGEAQHLANSADGLVAVAASLGARVEVRLSGEGPVERVHPVGFVDAMSATMFCLEAGLTEGARGAQGRPRGRPGRAVPADPRPPGRRCGLGGVRTEGRRRVRRARRGCVRCGSMPSSRAGWP